MNIEGILREIDAEIDMLRRIRSIVEGLSGAAVKKHGKPKRTRVVRDIQTEPKPEPRLIVVPPKQKRAYTRRVKPLVSEPKALAAPLSVRPVFVPRSMPAEPQPAKMDTDANALEATMRQKLLGGAA